MNKIKDLISKSTNPYIYAGHGCALYRHKFIRFIEELQIPVMLSWRAIDLIPDDHPLNAGRPGLVAQPEANKKIQQADLLLILGARVDDSLTAYNREQFAPRATKVVVDIDKAELDRLPSDYIKVNRDVNIFMDELLKVVDG